MDISRRDSLIDELEGFGRIQTAIEAEWGSVRLDKYLLELITDTKDGKRQGFPLKVMNGLIGLQRLNLEQLDENGIQIDEPDDLNSRILHHTGMWDLPKNF